jgi:hypothetical protein
LLFKRFQARKPLCPQALAILTEEIHPHTAYYHIQTLTHLLQHAPAEIFLMAAKSIRSSCEAGFQYDSLAANKVVELVQRALADHREIFNRKDSTESECLVALLEVLDLFVDAGWPQARQLTHRLEELYRWRSTAAIWMEDVVACLQAPGRYLPESAMSRAIAYALGLGKRNWLFIGHANTAPFSTPLSKTAAATASIPCLPPQVAHPPAQRNQLASQRPHTRRLGYGAY